MNYQIVASNQHFPLKSVFRIARGAKTMAEVVVVIIFDGNNYGWAEAVPYARYNESIAGVLNQIKQLSQLGINKSNADKLIATLPPGAARNALDCALWDLKANQQQTSVRQLLSLPDVPTCITAQTLSIDTPQAMAKAVEALDNPPLVKVKLDNVDIIEKMTALQQAAPDSQFIVDANEGWSIIDLQSCADELKQLNVILIEQPLPADGDHDLIYYQSPVALCADESCHTQSDLVYLQNRYQAINIKLDKTGGLTEAIALASEAKALGFELMLGCMVGSSLAMAPISLLTDKGQYIDLEGPLIIANDRPSGFEFKQVRMQPLNENLWGSGSDSNYQTVKELFNDLIIDV
ncbi:MAG: dipeptide epimerase [Alteromonadaceae bacterium]|nr:dipeptide epimerase [Alteromonadaceae bacterium]